MTRHNFESPYQTFDVNIFFGVQDFKSKQDKLLHVERQDDVPEVILDENFTLTEKLVTE